MIRYVLVDKNNSPDYILSKILDERAGEVVALHGRPYGSGVHMDDDSQDKTMAAENKPYNMYWMPCPPA